MSGLLPGWSKAYLNDPGACGYGIFAENANVVGELFHVYMYERIGEAYCSSQRIVLTRFRDSRSGLQALRLRQGVSGKIRFEGNLA